MSRSQVTTRTATTDDIPLLLALWDELRRLGGRAERAINPIAAVDIEERLAEVMVDPACRVEIACVGDVPAGMTVMRIARPDPLSDSQVVNIAHIYVSRAKRHHGVGHALLAAAADFAAENHLDHVAVSVYPSLREASRFYARLGFAPVAVRRVAPVVVLRRRLGADSTTPLLGDAVRRRTRLMRPVPTQRMRRSAAERIDS